MPTKDEDSIYELRKALEKALKDLRTKAAVDILSRLSEIKATQPLLKKTEIGKYINKLRKHSDSSVTDGVKSLLAKWKKDVGIAPISSPSTLPPAHSSSKSLSTAPSMSTLSRADSMNSTNSSTSNGTNTSEKPKSRTPATDGVKLPHVGDKIREKCLSMLYTSLATGNNSEPKHVLSLAVRIEELIYSAHPNPSSSEYKPTLLSFYHNLTRNSPLRHRVLSGSLPPDELITMSSHDLANEDLQKEMAQMKEKNLFEARGAGNHKATTDQFKCGKCKARKASYYQMQTRSADEPMTTFVECLNCGHHWKFC